MLGTSHDIDPSFIDSLPFPLQAPALELIRSASLKEMLEMRLNTSQHLIKDQYQLSILQWTAIINAVILTKVSYFKLEKGFPNTYIDKLIEIISNALGMPNKDSSILYQALIHDHPFLARWIEEAQAVKQKNATLNKITPLN